MKINRYLSPLCFIFLLALASCDAGKHYFRQRIGHAHEQKAEMPAPIGEEHSISQKAEPFVTGATVRTDTAAVPVMPPASLAAEKTEQGGHTAAAPAGVAEKATVHSATALRIAPLVQPDIKGNDKEGFILLAVLAALLIGLGLLLYFLLDVVGLIFLILFSLVAGILLILVLLALVF